MDRLGLDDGHDSAGATPTSRRPTAAAKRRSWLRSEATEREQHYAPVIATHISRSPEALALIAPFPEPLDIVTQRTGTMANDQYASSTPSSYETQAFSNHVRGDFSSAITSDAEDQDQETHSEIAGQRKELNRQLGLASKRQRQLNQYATQEQVDHAARAIDKETMADFFGAEVYQIVLRNPITAHRLLKFSQDRACGENMEFLDKVDRYHRLLNDLTSLAGEIHSTYTSLDAPKQINISGALSRQIGREVQTIMNTTVPAMDDIFVDAQDHIEKLVASDVYPRFVKHQVTVSAALALTQSKKTYKGLGDCFCLTDPAIADNPIVSASDGFVEVTGYDRRDIVPRNCRFLQGALTDRQATKRLKMSIDNAEETVELLLNYRKNGDPFWNLLYVAPLYDKDDRLIYFLGGQIDCSTTIHSCTDVLRILSINDEILHERPSSNRGRPALSRSSSGSGSERSLKHRGSFFKSWKKTSVPEVDPRRPQSGMERELLDKMAQYNFKTQVEAFYTAYSKYFVLQYSTSTGALNISHYSATALELVHLQGKTSIFGRDFFRVFSEHGLTPDTKAYRAAKTAVKESLQLGKAISVEMGLLLGPEVKKPGSGGLIQTLNLNGINDKKKAEMTRSEETFNMHWTPTKDEDGKVKYVVLTIAPK